MTSQLSYLIAQQRQAELAARAGQARRAGQPSDRSPATEKPRPATPLGPLPESPGCQPLCAHGMNPLTNTSYARALRRLPRG